MTEPGPTASLCDDLRVRIGGSHILQGVSSTCAPTGVTVLLGRNGVGKTTTLRAILGLLPPGAQVTGGVRLRRRAAWPASRPIGWSGAGSATCRRTAACSPG